jgi:hypothetical protein
MLIRFLEFQKIYDCYAPDTFEESKIHIEELLDWINKHITSYINYFGEELEKQIGIFSQFNDSYQ